MRGFSSFLKETMTTVWTGKTHIVTKMQLKGGELDGKVGYAVQNKDHTDVNEYETPALFDAIRAAKLYEAYLEEAHEYEPDTKWGQAKKQLPLPGIPN